LSTLVAKVQDIAAAEIEQLLGRYGIELVRVAVDTRIPGSYWGDSEAGLIGNRIYARADTPVHSLLHEGSHFVCMDDLRRSQLAQDAGGDYDEENAVCYLQILLAGHLPCFSRDRMLQDMDSWGYTFRLGSARAWFEQDAQDARDWLVSHGVIDSRGYPTWKHAQFAPC